MSRRSHVSIGLCLCLLIPALIACGRAGAPPAPSGSASGLAASPCPIAVADQGLDYSDVRAGLTTLFQENSDENSFAAALTAYTATVVSQTATGWAGWITSIQPHADTGTYTVAIDMDDFSSNDAVAPTVFAYEGEPRLGFVDLVLEDVPEAQIQGLEAGQRVRFDGRISQLSRLSDETLTSDFMNGHLALTLDNASIAAVTSAMLKECGLPERTVVTLITPVCTMSSDRCYTTTQVADSDGRTIYRERDWESNAITERSGAISPEDFAVILKAFEDADFYSLNDVYDEFDVSDSPEATTSISTPFRRKSVFHYYGDLSAPAVLQPLEQTVGNLIKA